MQILQRLRKKLSRNYLLLFFCGLMVLLLILHPVSFPHAAGFIHGPTILVLTTLLITTTGIQSSGLLEHWAGHFLQSVKTERHVWLCIVGFSALMATVLTNDVALFLIIPFTLQLNSRVPLKIEPLLIAETIAVNAGSMLTPIGNPQNIYLWQKSWVSFGKFTLAMLPVAALQIAMILALTFLLTSADTLDKQPLRSLKKADYNLAAVSAVLLLGFIIANHLDTGLYFAAAIAAIFLLFYPNVILTANWSLIILFVLLFVDVGIIARLPFVQAFSNSVATAKPIPIFSLGAGYAQIISNVPATLLLSHYTTQWKYLAWGVNIGGNGLLIASFANLIAVRLARQHKIGWKYHFYAIPFLLISGAFVYLWILLM